MSWRRGQACIYWGSAAAPVAKRVGGWCVGLHAGRSQLAPVRYRKAERCRSAAQRRVLQRELLAGRAGHASPLTSLSPAHQLACRRRRRGRRASHWRSAHTRWRSCCRQGVSFWGLTGSRARQVSVHGTCMQSLFCSSGISWRICPCPLAPAACSQRAGAPRVGRRQAARAARPGSTGPGAAACMAACGGVSACMPDRGVQRCPVQSTACTAALARSTAGGSTCQRPPFRPPHRHQVASPTLPCCPAVCGGPRRPRAPPGCGGQGAGEAEPAGKRLLRGLI